MIRAFLRLAALPAVIGAVVAWVVLSNPSAARNLFGVPAGTPAPAATATRPARLPAQFGPRNACRFMASAKPSTLADAPAEPVLAYVQAHMVHTGNGRTFARIASRVLGHMNAGDPADAHTDMGVLAAFCAMAGVPLPDYSTERKAAA